jgi:predicted phosphodiesterase
VRTLVVSDLHLGARGDADLVRADPAVLDALVAGAQDVDRLVLLGDTLELRHGPPRDALSAAKPVLRAVAGGLGAEAEVVLVAGNHDHRLVAPWLERRLEADDPPPLGLAERTTPDATPLAAAVAELLAPARVVLDYPGTWLREDVYALHGHYLDRHVTVPSFERLAAGALARLVGRPVGEAEEPDDYEAVLAPLYALLDAIAARSHDGSGTRHANASAKAWQLLNSSGRTPLKGALLAGAVPLGVGALNAMGLGPIKPDLSGEELRRSGLRAMAETVAALGVGAEHVIFGHTHRAGPGPGDDLAEWKLNDGGRLLNTGCWVRDPLFGAGDDSSPYRPGAAVLVDGDAAPRPLRLL